MTETTQPYTGHLSFHTMSFLRQPLCFFYNSRIPLFRPYRKPQHGPGVPFSFFLYSFLVFWFCSSGKGAGGYVSPRRGFLCSFRFSWGKKDGGLVLFSRSLHELWRVLRCGVHVVFLFLLCLLLDMRHLEVIYSGAGGVLAV